MANMVKEFVATPESVNILGKAKREENLKFRVFLKRKADSDELDKQFKELHEKLFNNYDCTRCNNCCKEYSGVIIENEITKNAKLFNMSEKEFIDKYLVLENGEFRTKNKPCDFLSEDGNCMLGDNKPIECVEYPYTNKKDVIKNLTPDDALYILNILSEEKELEEKIYQIAIQIFDDVDLNKIADDVYYSLNSIQVEDLWDSSGAMRYGGYIEPSERAWEMFEEELEPFVKEMKKYKALNIISLSKKYCMGIIKGIIKYEEESNSDFADWVEDAPCEFKDRVFEEWKKGIEDQEAINEVLQILND